MNSYFASVEQQARPALRGRPIGVTGPSKRSIIVAASIEAKKFGVKTGTQIWEAKKLCPQIILIRADCNRYEAITRQFLEIFISKTPQVEIFSIDEAFLDMTDQCPPTINRHCHSELGSGSRGFRIACLDLAEPRRKSGMTKKSGFQQAEKIALEIKKELHHKIGAHVRCSVGIAQNKFMAKLASEAHKPDGLTIVAPGEEIKFLDQFNLTDACGIGRRISAHLERLGIDSFKKLRAMCQTDLTLIFKSYGLRLYNMARGIDNDPIHPYYLAAAPKSVSRSKTLARNTFDKILLEKMLLSFCQNIAAELREKNMLGGSAAVWLRFGDFTHAGLSRKIKSPTNLTNDLFFHSKEVLSRVISSKSAKGGRSREISSLTKPVRKIGLWIGDLTPDPGQLEIFDNRRKLITLESIVDLANRKHGRQILTRSSLVGLNFGGKAPSYGFKKDVLT